MPENTETTTHPEDSQIRRIAFFVWETIKVIIFSLAIVIPVRYFLIQPFFVKGESMEPNFHNQDYIIVDKLGYRLNKPIRGDVIVFKYPDPNLNNPSQYLIKRIIGLPGEKVQLKDSQLIISNTQYPHGFVLDEQDYLVNGTPRMESLTRQLKDNEYFVMGDNRYHSSDSRSWGGVDQSLISGRALVRLWPFDQVGTFHHLDYTFKPLPQ